MGKNILYLFFCQLKRGSCNGKSPKILGVFEEPRIFLFHAVITSVSHCVAILWPFPISQIYFSGFDALFTYLRNTYLLNLGYSGNIFDTISSAGSWSMPIC